MVQRIAGALLLVASVPYWLFGLLALVQSPQLSRTSAVLATIDPFLDPERWIHQGRTTTIAVLCFGVTGATVGIGMLRRDRWALSLCCTLVTVVLGVGLYMRWTGHLDNPLALESWVSITALTTLTAFGWLALILQRGQGPAEP